MLANLQKSAEIKEIERAATERAKFKGRFEVGIHDGDKASWYAVTVMPNHEAIAAAHLAARRIGVLQPQFPTEFEFHGKKRRVMRNLIPGYLFVFVWGIERHARRILACTGVTGIAQTAFGKYVVIPDAKIDEIRASENEEWPFVYVEERLVKRRRRKKYTQSIERKETPISKGDILSLHAGSYWNEEKEVAETERISKLKVALGLAS